MLLEYSGFAPLGVATFEGVPVTGGSCKHPSDATYCRYKAAWKLLRPSFNKCDPGLHPLRELRKTHAQWGHVTQTEEKKRGRPVA
eukprot:2238696-Amphidinium_carterae.1